MKKITIKYFMMVLLAGATAGFGLTSCNTGTEPGETNVERSEIEYPEESGANRTYSADTSDEYDEYYEGREGTAIGDSAYVQGDERQKRNEKRPQQQNSQQRQQQ